MHNSRSFLLSIAALAAVTLAQAGVAQADVVISEVLYNPARGDSEFIELYNPLSWFVELYDEEAGRGDEGAGSAAGEAGDAAGACGTRGRGAGPGPGTTASR